MSAHRDISVSILTAVVIGIQAMAVNAQSEDAPPGTGQLRGHGVPAGMLFSTLPGTRRRLALPLKRTLVSLELTGSVLSAAVCWHIRKAASSATPAAILSARIDLDKIHGNVYDANLIKP